MLLPGPAQIQGGPSTGGGVPDGGTTGQVIQKQSNADQDAAWATPAAPSDETPLPASGVGGPGDGTNYSREGHFHPADAASAGGSDAYTVVAPANPTSGDVCYFPWINAGVSTFNDSRCNSMPFRITASAIYKLGVKVTGGGATGSLIRLGVFADDNNGRGPGTLLSDLGTVVSTATGIFFTIASVALAAGPRYWPVVQTEGGAASPATLASAPTLFNPVQFDGGGNPGQRYNWSHSGAFASNPAVNVDPNPMVCVFFKVA